MPSCRYGGDVVGIGDKGYQVAVLMPAAGANLWAEQS